MKIFDRIREPSSWSGLGAVIGGIALAAGGQYEAGISAALGGLLGVIMPEGRS